MEVVRRSNQGNAPVFLMQVTVPSSVGGVREAYSDLRSCHRRVLEEVGVRGWLQGSPPVPVLPRFRGWEIVPGQETARDVVIVPVWANGLESPIAKVDCKTGLRIAETESPTGWIIVATEWITARTALITAKIDCKTATIVGKTGMIAGTTIMVIGITAVGTDRGLQVPVGTIGGITIPRSRPLALPHGRSIASAGRSAILITRIPITSKGAITVAATIPSQL